MRFIELVLLTCLLSSGYSGQGLDAVKNDKPSATATADCKAILEKFAQAYSALDDNSLLGVRPRYNKFDGFPE